MQHRRHFLMRTGTLLTTLWNTRTPLLAAPSFVSDPFQLGVASGDPAADGFVLWTRLAPKPLEGGGMPDAAVEVQWRVAEDEAMKRVVKKGKAIASPMLAHSVHVEVAGCKPDRWYWYEFKVGKFVSTRGRTRTAPAPGQTPEKFRFAVASCQHWETGYYTAYEHMAAENADVVFHLGDYIYEGPGRDKQIRKHTGLEIKSLADYRNRHALYKTDKALQRMHALAPWVVTWDDHEVDNNYAADIPEDKQTRAELLERRASAYQAFYEHMPLRAAAAPKGSSMLLYRSLQWGRLATIPVLDTRQYRTDQPCGDGNKEPCPAVYEADATLLGETQHAWLEKTLAAAESRWQIIAQQVMVGRVDFKIGEGERFSMDQWGGYEVCRKRLLHFFGEKRIANPIVLTGDIHSNWAHDLKTNWGDPSAPAVGVEFVGTSISSSGDGRDAMAGIENVYSENPNLKWHNARRGYIVCEMSASSTRADYRTLDFVTKPGAPVKTARSFVVEAGRPGLNNA